MNKEFYILTNPVILGKIKSIYGVRGWLKIFSFTEKIDDIFYYHLWYYRNKIWQKN